MRRPRRFSILWLITGATLLPLLVLGVSLLWLTTRSAQRTNTVLARQVLNEASQRAEASAANYLERAGRLSMQLAALLQSGAIAPNDLDVWRDLLFAHMRANPEISSIQFVNARLESTYLSRYNDGLEFGVSRIDPDRPDALPLLTTHAATLEGALDPASVRVVDNDPRERPWHQLALNTSGPAWTPPYRWQLGNRFVHETIWGVAYTRAVRDEAGQLLGVLSIDVSFSQLSGYLANIAGPLSAHMQIRAKSEQVLALSHPQAPGIDDPIESALNAWVQQTAGTEADTTTQLEIASVPYLMRATNLKIASIDGWRLLIAIPESPFLADSRADLRQMKIISALTVLGSMIAAMWIARLVSRPIRRLAAFATRVGEGDFEQRISARSTHEVDQLSAALNTMAASLHERVALLAARDAALESSAAKAKLIAHVSHEFRTPLNAIINYAELLRDQSQAGGRPRDAQDAANILIASQHLLTLINNLLDLSRAEAGRLKLELTRFALADLINEVVVTVRPGVERNGNRFIVEPAPQATLNSDAARIKQVLINLLNNAGKFTVEGEVRLSSHVEDDSVEFSVCDTGRGVSQADIERIFEPFTQVDASDRATSEGAGLGLAITRQLVQILNGSLRLESAPNLGTTVRVTLPLCHRDPGGGTTISVSREHRPPVAAALRGPQEV